MSTNTSIQDAIGECHDGGTPEVRILELLADQRPIVRYNAMLALGTRVLENDDAVTEALKQAAAAPCTTKPLIGTMTERMMAAYALHSIDSPASRRALEQVKAALTEIEMSDLRWNIAHNPLRANIATTPDSEPPSTPRG